MTQIPPFFWMTIISILTIGVFFLLFYLAMSAKELSIVIRNFGEVVSEFDETVQTANKLVSAIESKINEFLSVLDEVNKTLIIPIRAIQNVMNRVSK
jgi:cell shape-determining protein MreC